jgi:O-antigen ligase
VLQVTALPMLLSAMCRPGPGLQVAAGVAAGVAGAQLALSDSVVGQALGGTVLAAAAIAPGATVRAERWSAVAACLVVMASALGAHAALGGYARPIANPGDGERLAALAAAVLVPPALWLLVRGRLDGILGSLGPRGNGRAAAGVGAAALVVVVIGALALADDAGRFKVRGVAGDDGAVAGRTELWGHALDAAFERPLAGHGSESFRAASAEEQSFPPIRYAHSLPLELWVELGLAGLALALLIYGGGALAIWRARGTEAAWLFGPGVAAFLIANLLDWPWHLAGAGAIWALCVGGLVGARGSAPGESDISRAGHESAG